MSIPKSTFSHWFKDLTIPVSLIQKFNRRDSRNLQKGRDIALRQKHEARRLKQEKANISNRLLYRLFSKDLRAQKIALAMLYLAEGSKKKRGSLVFCNSDPEIINLFLSLLRRCLKIDESKFRITVQCRADQDVLKLEKFWSRITAIPRRNFYKVQVDARTVGKPTRKPDYKGVCRIDYFSSDVDFELKCIANELKKM